VSDRSERVKHDARSPYGEHAPGRLVPITVTEPDRRLGTLVDKQVQAFIPNPLPDSLPLDDELEGLLGACGTRPWHAQRAWNAACEPVPPHPRPFIRREAVASSSIEGTVTNLEQLLLFEEAGVPESPRHDAQEVLNYVRALEYGLNRELGRPLSGSLIREMHALLMAEQADDAATRGQRWLQLREEYRQRYQGRPPVHALAVIDQLFSAPTQTLPGLRTRLGLEFSSVRNVVSRLVEDGLLVEVTGRQRGRVFVAPEIITILAAP
jgi:Fic family protein